MTPTPQCRHCACTPALPCPGGCVWISEEPRLCSACAGTTNLAVFGQVLSLGLSRGVVAALIGYVRTALRQPESEGLDTTPAIRELVGLIEAQLVKDGAFSEAGLTLLHQLEAAGRPRILLSRETNGRMIPHSMGAA